MTGRLLKKWLLSALSPSGRRGRLTILTFHRVLEKRDPLLPGEPDAQRFAEMLGWLTDLCQVLPLEEGIQRLQHGGLPARAAAITFDDGYRNNLTIAKPALVSAGVPATVFLAAEPVRGGGIMWNDRVIEGVRRAQGSHDLSDLNLGIVDLDSGDLPQTIDSLLLRLKYRPLEERESVSIELYRRLAGGDPPRLMLHESEVRDLAGDGIALGAHTMRHPILKHLSDSEAMWEISESRRWLADLTGDTPALFAYPNGQVGDDYEKRHVDMVREAGYAAAVTTNWGAAQGEACLHELPRYTPWEKARGGFQSRIIKTTAISYVDPGYA